MYFVFLVLACFGLAYIVGQSQISLPFRAAWFAGASHPKVPAVPAVIARALLNLIECPACFGFWEGLLYGVLNGYGMGLACAYGLMICATNLLLAKLAGLM